MKAVNAEYTKNYCCKVYHEFSGSTILTDASKGTDSKGFTPPELFAISLVTCMATMMGFEAEALKLDISGMKMAVEFEMSSIKPRRVTKIHSEFWIPSQVNDHQKELFANAAKNCPIKHSIHPDIVQTMEFYYPGEE